MPRSSGAVSFRSCLSFLRRKGPFSISGLGMAEPTGNDAAEVAPIDGHRR